MAVVATVPASAGAELAGAEFGRLDDDALIRRAIELGDTNWVDDDNTGDPGAAVRLLETDVCRSVDGSVEE